MPILRPRFLHRNAPDHHRRPGCCHARCGQGDPPCQRVDHLPKPHAQGYSRLCGEAAEIRHVAPPRRQYHHIGTYFFRIGPDLQELGVNLTAYLARFRRRSGHKLDQRPGARPRHRPDVDLLGHNGCGRHGGNVQYDQRHRARGEIGCGSPRLPILTARRSSSPTGPLPTSAGFRTAGSTPMPMYGFPTAPIAKSRSSRRNCGERDVGAIRRHHSQRAGDR